MQPDFDQIHRFIFDGTDIRGEIVTLKNSYRDATAHQNLPDFSKQLLGEFLAAAAILGETLKFDGLLTLQARGNGAIPLIMAEIDNLGHVRGIVKQGDQQIPSAGTLPEVIGNGVLVLTIDPKNGERYQGIVPLEKATLSECLSDYFERSEQLSTKLVLFSNTHMCSGVLLQALPMQLQKDEDVRHESWSTAIQFLNTLSAQESFELDHNTVLHRLFNEMQCKIFGGKTIQFHCHCSRKRSAVAVNSLGLNDARELIDENGAIDINCDFCGTAYQFKKDDLKNIFGPKDSALH